MCAIYAEKAGLVAFWLQRLSSLGIKKDLGFAVPSLKQAKVSSRSRHFCVYRTKVPARRKFTVVVAWCHLAPYGRVNFVPVYRVAVYVQAVLVA